MPKSLSMLDASSGIVDAALLYMVDLTLEPPERKITAAQLAAFVQKYARTVEVLSGSSPVHYSTTDKSTVVVVIGGTVPAVIVEGAPQSHSQFLFINGTPNPVTLSSASGFLGVPTTAVSEVVLKHYGDALMLTRAPSPPAADVWVGVHLIGAGGVTAELDILRTVQQSNSPDGDPEFVWSFSGTELTTRSITLPPGKWLIEARGLFRAPPGGTYMAPTLTWADLSTSPSGVGAGYWGGGPTILLTVPAPTRVVTPSASTTYTLKASLDYSGGTGSPGAWVFIVARRAE